MILQDMAFDLRPRVVFHTSLGAVVVTVDPSTPLGGVVQIPGVGNVPYDVDITGPSMIVHLPVYGDAVIPLIPSGSATPLSIPGLGSVTYEVVFGPVDIPPEQMANTAALGSFFDPMFLVTMGGVLAVWLLWPKAKRNPGKKRKGQKAWTRRFHRTVDPASRYWTEAQWQRVEELNRAFHAMERRKRFRLIRGHKHNPMCGCM